MVDQVVVYHRSILEFLISELIWQGQYETGQFALYSDYEHFHSW